MEEAFISWIKKVQEDKSLESLDTERKAKRAIIERIFSYLGWDIHNPDEVYEEFPIPHETERVDYSLQYEGINKVFIEVKKVGTDLEYHRKQLIGYCSLFGVRLAVLTNGIIWWLYLPISEGNFNQKKFCTIDLSDQKIKSNDIVKMFEKFLSKENVVNGKAVKSAENLLNSKQKEFSIDQTLPKAWNKIKTDQNAVLIKLISNATEKMCGCKPSPEVVKKFIMSLPPQVSPPIISKPTKMRKRRMSHQNVPKKTDESDMSYTKPLAFSFKGERTPVTNWTELLMGVAEKMYLLHKDQFSGILEIFPYFSTNSLPKREGGDLRQPRLIEGSNIYIETNLNANQSWDIARQIITRFEPLEKLEVELRK